MDVYFRILRYAPGLQWRLVQFFVYAILGVIFGTTYLVLVIPMLEVLFDENKFVEGTEVIIPEIPDFAFTKEYVTGLFNHYQVQYIAEQGKVGALIFVCVMIVVMVILANLFRYFERITASRIRVDVVKNMRMDFFSHVSNLHIGYFNNQRKGDLISRFTNDVQETETAVVNSLKSVWKEPIQITVLFLVLFSISIKLTLFTLVVLPITGGAISTIIKRLKRKAKQSQESLGRIVNILDETFGGMRVIKAFNARNFVLNRIDQETSYHRKVNLSISRKNELSSPLSEVLGVIIVAIIIYYGGHLVLSKDPELTPAQFMGFLTVYASMIQPAKNFTNGLTSLQKGTAAARRIFEIIDTEPVVKDSSNAQMLPSFQHSIVFQNVSFAYDAENIVLKNINLEIKKGMTVALVGPSGGGKSTLADLVPRFYDPTSGDILIDGVSLRDYEMESLRQHMGIVTQESILFNDTIFNNIAFGLPNVKEEDVVKAARVANAHDFIMQTEMGYHTVIGERGSKLSGGQRQRISIARAVLKNPEILILDEATSALDSESERLVQDALNNLMKNRTSIVIAHRLSTIQHADEIVVIQQGEIVERGTHQNLSQQKGLYQKLTQIQKV
jgi:subfamily B ATP-binding cassette protein MsbA